MKQPKFKLNLQLFAEENTNVEEPANQEDPKDTRSIAEIIKDYKENFVPKAEYEKLDSELKNVVKSTLDGSGLDTEKGESTRTVEDIRKELFSPKSNLSNLEAAKAMLDLRDKLIKEGKPDPFLPSGTNVDVSEYDIKRAEAVAETFRHCIEYADGDSDVFTGELMRLTKDSNPKAKSLF